MSTEAWNTLLTIGCVVLLAALGAVVVAMFKAIRAKAKERDEDEEDWLS